MISRINSSRIITSYLSEPEYMLCFLNTLQNASINNALTNLYIESYEGKFCDLRRYDTSDLKNQEPEDSIMMKINSHHDKMSLLANL